MGSIFACLKFAALAFVVAYLLAGLGAQVQVAAADRRVTPRRMRGAYRADQDRNTRLLGVLTE